MRYVEAPNALPKIDDSDVIVFLAGGISNCPDWQSEAVALLEQSGIADRLVLVNPRRKEYIEGLTAASEQIVWEHFMLRASHIILFWFPCETVCPITLYELGAWSTTDKPIVIGTHPNYSRRFDVVTQTSLVRPKLSIYSDLRDVVYGTVFEVNLHLDRIKCADCGGPKSLHADEGYQDVCSSFKLLVEQ